jgi:hypothetical protein
VVAVVGYAMGPDNAAIHVVADDLDKACSALQSAGFDCQKSEAVAVELPNTPGACARMMRDLANEGIALEHCYASASGDKALCVFRSSDNAKTLSVLGQ